MGHLEHVGWGADVKDDSHLKDLRIPVFALQMTMKQILFKRSCTHPTKELLDYLFRHEALEAEREEETGTGGDQGCGVWLCVPALRFAVLIQLEEPACFCLRISVLKSAEHI